MKKKMKAVGVWKVVIGSLFTLLAFVDIGSVSGFYFGADAYEMTREGFASVFTLFAGVGVYMIVDGCGNIVQAGSDKDEQ